MSNIDNRHNVQPFTSGESKPFSGQRLAKVGYKSSKTAAPKFKSVCVSIPVVTNWSESQAGRLAPAFRELVQDVQDKIIRSLYEAADGTLSSVSDEEISVDQVIAYLEAERTGDRLTREMVGEWFRDSLADNLTVLFCEKLGTEDTEDVRVVQQLNAYRGLFQSIVKDSGSMQVRQIDGLLRALEVTAADGPISSRVRNKLEEMKNKPKIEELLGL